MRKVLFAVSIVTMLLFSGCTDTDTQLFQQPEGSIVDVDNSDEVIVVEDLSLDNASEYVTDGVDEDSSLEEIEKSETENLPEEDAEEYFNLELNATDNPRIAELLNVSGTYTDSVGNVDDYVYQIPQFYADSESAKVVNDRILYDIVDNIYDEFLCMDGGYSLFCYNITYEVIENGDVVSIIVSAPYPNDWVEYYAYSYDFGQDKEVSNSELLAMYGWTEETFIEEACLREKEYFERQIKDIYPDMSEEEINIFLLAASHQTTVDLPMYIGTDGKLYVYLPMPSVAGADWYYGLEQF